jgi:hypothetical protein
MQLFHLLLLVASCIANSMVRTDLELDAYSPDGGFRRYSHNRLALYMRSMQIDEYFVSKNLLIGGNSYGPCYFNLNPKIEGGYQIIDVLDFGRLSEFDGLDLQLDPKKDRAILWVLNNLIKPEIFESIYKILIKNVIVNGKNYGSHTLTETFYQQNPMVNEKHDYEIFFAKHN